jgi:hypothetical protein
MSLESDLYAELSGDAGLTTLVGESIYPSHVSEGTATPFVVYSTVFHEGIYHLDGDTDLTRARMQVDCYAEDPDTASSIALAVIAAIPETGRPIHRSAHSNRDLGLDPDTRLFRRMLEFSIFHRSS